MGSLAMRCWTIYYHMLGGRLFGDVVKYPLFRPGHVPETLLRRELCLDFSGRRVTTPGWPPPKKANLV